MEIADSLSPGSSLSVEVKFHEETEVILHSEIEQKSDSLLFTINVTILFSLHNNMYLKAQLLSMKLFLLFALRNIQVDSYYTLN